MYAGHRSEDGRVQELAAHPHQTAELCAQHAAPFGAADFARLIGLCHDIGKYSQKVQDRILRNGSKSQTPKKAGNMRTACAAENEAASCCGRWDGTA